MDSALPMEKNSDPISRKSESLAKRLIKAAQASNMADIRRINREIEAFVKPLSREEKNGKSIVTLGKIHAETIKRLSSALDDIETKRGNLSKNQDGLRAYEETGTFS